MAMFVTPHLLGFEIWNAFVAPRLLGKNYFYQLILLFSLFLLLLISLTILLNTIHEPYYTILTKFYFYLKYIQ